MATYLVQLSDPHVCAAGDKLFGRIDTAAMLQAAVVTVQGLKQAPDAVLITGDLVNAGTSAEYAQVARILAPLPMPVYLMPGNHDDRQQLRAAFPRHTYLGAEGFMQYSVQVGRLRLLALDTVVPGQPHGELCATRLSWLHAQLDAHRDKPVIVAMHHPPFATLVGHMDEMALLGGAAEFERLIGQYPNVERVVCGHVHRAIETRFAGTIASVAPGTAHQIELDLAPHAPPAWTLEPPGFAVHACAESGRVVSHLVATGPHPGPFAFGD